MGISLEDWRKRGREYLHRGHGIFYVDEGQGAPLVCIHGFPTASWDWAPLWPELTRRYRVIAPDMIGFGFSAKPRDYQYSILDQADLFEGLLAHLGVTEVLVLAHDYGDTVAQELLARHNERSRSGQLGLRLRSVCFLNGGLFPETHRPRFVQKLLQSPIGPLISRLMNRRSFDRSFSAVFGPQTQPSPAELAAFWQLLSHNGGQRLMHKLIRYMAERREHRERWVGALCSAKIPLRVIDGAVDPVSGAHMVARYRELVPNPDTVMLPTIGHYPQVEAPQAVLAAYLEFAAPTA
ncbi:MAG: alpha/beta fold hydrolase [Nevskiales bacterium]